MNFIDRFKRFFNSADKISIDEINAMFNSNLSYQYGADISEITYFTCLKALAESLGKLPLYLIDSDKKRVDSHDTVKLFSVQPNEYMTPIQFFTYMEYCRNHYGNAYAYIKTDARGHFIGLYPLAPQGVQIWVNNTEAFTDRTYYYSYADITGGRTYWLRPEEVIHVKSWIVADNGLAGKSVREILAANMAGAKASQKFLNDLYQHGLTANAVVKYVGDLSPEKQKILLKRIEEQARDDGRRLISLPVGFDIQTLDLKLTDSQFYELKKYNALQVAAAFGIKPNILNDYSKSSYANSATQNLSFYIDTLLYNLSLYEQELNRKLLTGPELAKGMGFKFNVRVILRGDPTQQSDIINKLTACGVYSINDARRLLDEPSIEGGDVHTINGSMVDISDIGIAYRAREGGDNDD